MSSPIKYKRVFVGSSGSSGGSGVLSVNSGTDITVDNTDPANPIVNFTGTYQDPITVVANYSALPAPGTVTGEFYWCSASQGTAWLPGALGGTYYSAGMYYSNGVSWEFMDVPYQATQSEVNTGTNTDKFVTPATLTNWTGRSLTVGTTTISGGTTTRILYDNAGVLGEYTLTGTGTVVAMQTSPTFSTSANITAITATTSSNDIVNTLTNNSSGTPAANYGLSRLIQLKSSTTDSQTAGKEIWYWSTATHASRQSAYTLQLVGNASVGTLQDAFRIVANGNSFQFDFVNHSTYDPKINLYSGSTNKGAWQMSGNDMYFSTFTGGAGIHFRPGNASEMIYLTTTGMFVGGSTTPTSTLHVGGSFQAAYVAKTSNYTLTASDFTVNCTSGSFDITLPTAVSITGRIYVINNSTATTITLKTTSAQTIDGNASGTLTLAANKSYTVQSDGANWIIIAQK